MLFKVVMPVSLDIHVVLTLPGRAYLSQIPILLKLLTDTLKTEEKDSPTKEIVLMALQKLSLRSTSCGPSISVTQCSFIVVLFIYNERFYAFLMNRKIS